MVEKEQKALALQNADRWQEASVLWLEILNDDPAWEHGSGYFCLGNCYWDLGRLDEARAAFELALSYEQYNFHYLSNRAVLILTIQGNSSEAYEAHLRLLQVVAKEPLSEHALSVIPTIGKALNYSDAKIAEDIAIANEGIPKDSHQSGNPL